jgi:GPN-loop GTPase
VPFGVNIDIRDTVNYKEVMKQYNLGPNGGILTSLNLFATRFDQVIQYAEKRSSELRCLPDMTSCLLTPALVFCVGMF